MTSVTKCKPDLSSNLLVLHFVEHLGVVHSKPVGLFHFAPNWHLKLDAKEGTLQHSPAVKRRRMAYKYLLEIWTCVLLKCALGVLKSGLLAQVVALTDVVTGFLCKDCPANSVWSCWETLSLSLTLTSCSSAMFCWARWPQRDISTWMKQQVWRVMWMSWGSSKW